jgi:CMP-N,N'-diacetyllegionaminic acid synthase
MYMNSPKVLAIIPARGGSKGVPRKNIKKILGKPLIAHTIEQAMRSSCISEVVVNTDDKDIARVSKKYGANIFFRSKKLAQDLTEDLPVFEDHLLKLAKRNTLPDIVVDLRATAPLRTARRIDEGVKLLMCAGRKKADSVRAVTKVDKHPYKMWKFKDMYLKPFVGHIVHGIKEPYNAPRQILPDVHQNNGAMNAFWPETILKKRSMTGRRILGFYMEPWESINIDTEIDFLIAEVLMQKHCT